MRSHPHQLALLLTLLLTPTVASAHYMWVSIDPKAGEHGAALIIFEESPFARGGEYLDHFSTTGKTWVRTVEETKPQPIETVDTKEEDKRWLQGPLPAAAPRSIESYGKFGVYLYGKTPVLLHYYAKYLDVKSHEDLHDLGQSEQMLVDLVPHDHEKEMEVTLLWKGEPAADRTVRVRGPKKFSQNIQTDAKGMIRFTPEAQGQYTFHAYIEEATPGKDGDDEYKLIRHHGTVVMQLPLED